MNTIKILIFCLITTFGFAQKKLNKVSQSVKVNKDVIVDLNTNYVEIEIDTWNKDLVEVQAYLESETLSTKELQQALEAWNLKVDATADKVTISSMGGKTHGRFPDGAYTTLLRDLEYQLIEMPKMPTLPDLGELPKLPKLPKMPELPALPKGVNTIDFDYQQYQKNGEKYLAEWSKKYEEKGGKEFQKRMEEWAKKFTESGYQAKMEEWGKQFGETYGKDMAKWGEEFGKKYDEDWAQKMEAWGERFGKEMEERAIEIEKRAEFMEQRGETMAKGQEELERHHMQLAEERSSVLTKGLGTTSNTKLKKIIKIKIPKKAKLKIDVRHGELKIVSAVNNVIADLSHSFLVAQYIDGGDTSINVSYSPIIIETWNSGTLNLNFVDKAQIKDARDLILNSNSSNINIERLTETGIIDGSFGDLTISNLTDTFKNLNLVLENSDALVNLPKDINYILYFKGDRSKYNNKPTTQKTILNVEEGQNANRNIMVNAKFSNVIIN